MPRVRRVLEAATELATLLSAASIPYCFHGGFLAVILGSGRETEELRVIVEGGFRRVREALTGSEKFQVRNAPWSARLYATYQIALPAIDIEVVNAGEEGPRRLDHSTTMIIQNLPFLSVTEFLRAKLKSWMLRGLAEDAHDIAFMLTRYYSSVDINRIPEQDMARFVSIYTSAAAAWDAVRQRYGV